MSEVKKYKLTTYQKNIWLQIKKGAIIRRFKKMNDVECWRFLTKESSVIGYVKDSCVRKLKKMERIIITNNGYQKNPNWHGKNNIRKKEIELRRKKEEIGKKLQKIF